MELGFETRVVARCAVGPDGLVAPDDAAATVSVEAAHVPADLAAGDLLAALPADEQARAHRYLFDGPRACFLVARTLLRRRLGEALGVPPAEVPLSYGEHGRPELPAEHAALHFNVSHSGDVVLLALARDHEVGVDVERVRDDVRWADLARRFFSPRESRQLLEEVDATDRSQAFFRCWTRKEAYLKAKGAGLTFPLRRFDVTLAPADPPRLLRTEVDGDRPDDWLYADVDPAPGYLGALIVRRWADA